MRREPHIPDRRKDSIPSTQEASTVSLAYHGKTVSNTEVLPRANLPSMFTLLRQRRLRWMGACLPHGGWPHPKRHSLRRVGIWKRSKGSPQLRYKDVCKTDMKALDINTDSWEDLAADRMMWRSTLNQHLKTGEKKLVNAEVRRRTCRKERNNSNRSETTHKSDFYGRDCFSHIGLNSHKRRCNYRTDRRTSMYSHDQT